MILKRNPFVIEKRLFHLNHHRITVSLRDPKHQFRIQDFHTHTKLHSCLFKTKRFCTLYHFKRLCIQNHNTIIILSWVCFFAIMYHTHQLILPMFPKRRRSFDFAKYLRICGYTMDNLQIICPIPFHQLSDFQRMPFLHKPILAFSHRNRTPVLLTPLIVWACYQACIC